MEVEEGLKLEIPMHACIDMGYGCWVLGPLLLQALVPLSPLYEGAEALCSFLNYSGIGKDWVCGVCGSGVDVDEVDLDNGLCSSPSEFLPHITQGLAYVLRA